MTDSPKNSGRGVRFAPSPTGRFHLGNLRTAWVSWTLAKRLGDPWVCRFEDIDQPRVLNGAMESQLEDIKTLGLVPDEVLVQTAFHDRHLDLFNRARESGQVYPCFCSRKEILEALQTSASAPHQEPPVYNGKCRHLIGAPWSELPKTTHPTVAWRFRGADPEGSQDFIIGRTGGGRTGGSTTPPDLDPSANWLKTFVPAYHWACAIDDYDGGYRLLVRAWDLSHAMASQQAIHDWLCKVEKFKPAPAVFHCALMTGPQGERLEKRTRGVTLPEVLNSGHSIEAVISAFEQSFDESSTIPDKPGGSGGENQRTLRVHSDFL